MNRNGQAGISPGEAVSKVAVGMREITVKVSGSKGRHGSGTVWRPGLIVTNAHVANSQDHDVEFATGRKALRWLAARDRELDLAAPAVSAPFSCAITSDAAEQFLSRFHLSEAA